MRLVLFLKAKDAMVKGTEIKKGLVKAMPRRRNKLILFVASLMAVIFTLTACGSNQTDDGFVDYSGDVKENPIVTIMMDNDEKIVIELLPKTAPNTVANFISLVEQGFYDGLTFHRVIPGFMIQGGDPEGNGFGGPGYSIKGEFTSNGFENNLKHERGVVSMARTPKPNTAGSQFFIMVGTANELDGDYAAFGKVIEGIEVADAISIVDRDRYDMPLDYQTMKKVEVDTKGFDYPEPVVIK